MRYKINNKLRTIVKNNKEILIKSNKKLRWPIKNVLYNNISISDDLLDELCHILKIDMKTLKVSEIKFQKEKNFGDYAKPAKVKFDGISEDFAEFIGIILGDGNVYKNSIRIMLDKRERDYRKHIKGLFYNLFNIRLNEYECKNSNEARLYKASKNLTRILLKYGLKRGNKVKNNINIPKWILRNKEFTSRCIKGLMDTDGCVYWNKRDERTYIKFTNSSSGILDGFKCMANTLGIKFVKSGRTSVCLYKRSEIGYDSHRLLSKNNNNKGFKHGRASHALISKGKIHTLYGFSLFRYVFIQCYCFLLRAKANPPTVLLDF